MEPLKIFYSWQSWSPRKTNWYFIQEAIEMAIKRLKADPEVEIVPRLDRDTQGEPGSVEIANTIFKKIDSSQIFLCDVTIVTPPTQDKNEHHSIPNPNVMLELGYAAKRMGWENIICVFNEAYGKIEEMPFDLKGRRLMGYNLPETSPNKAEVKNQLANEIYNAIKVIISNIKPPVPLLSLREKARQLIGDEKKQSELEELLIETVENSRTTFTGEKFHEKYQELLLAKDMPKLWHECFQLYFNSCEDALELFADIMLHGNTNQILYVERALKRWIEGPQGEHESKLWTCIPFALLLYVCGISAIYRRNWNYILSVLLTMKAINPLLNNNSSMPVIDILGEELYRLFHRNMPRDYNITIGQEIMPLIRPIFKKLIVSEADFRDLFHLFEVLINFCYLASRQTTSKPQWMPPHEAIGNDVSWEYIEDFWKQRGKEANHWELIGGGFLRTPHRVREVLTLYQECSNEFKIVYHHQRSPEYLSAYEEGLSNPYKQP